MSYHIALDLSPWQVLCQRFSSECRGDECSASRLQIKPLCVSTINLTQSKPHNPSDHISNQCMRETQPSKKDQAHTVACSYAVFFFLQLRISVSSLSHKARQVKQRILEKYLKRNTRQESVVILNLLYRSRYKVGWCKWCTVEQEPACTSCPVLWIKQWFSFVCLSWAWLLWRGYWVSLCPPFNSVVSSLACLPALLTKMQTVSCHTLLASSIQTEKTNREMTREGVRK